MKRLALIGALAVPIILTACENAPLEPQAKPQAPQYDVTDGGLGKLAMYKRSFPSWGSRAFKVIGPAGGTLSVAGFEVNVPAGAVSSPTMFTITLPTETRKLGYVIAEFGPHNVTFNVPVTLTLPYRGTSSDEQGENEGENLQLTPHVLWNNGIDWVPLPSWLTSDGRIQTQTNHFSEYGTEDPGRGITPVGG